VSVPVVVSASVLGVCVCVCVSDFPCVCVCALAFLSRCVSPCSCVSAYAYLDGFIGVRAYMHMCVCARIVMSVVVALVCLC